MYGGKGKFGPCSDEAMSCSTYPIPLGLYPSPIVGTNPWCTGVNTPHPPLEPQSSPEGPNEQKSHLGKWPRKAKGYLTQDIRQAGLHPTSSWNFYQLNNIRTRIGSYNCSVLYLFYLFPFCPLIPSYWRFE